MYRRAGMGIVVGLLMGVGIFVVVMHTRYYGYGQIIAVPNVLLCDNGRSEWLAFEQSMQMLGIVVPGLVVSFAVQYGLGTCNGL